MRLMTARLDLIAHGASAATREARFPNDEALEASAVDAVEALRGRLRPYGCVLTAPARAARETAAALGLEADVETALRECDYGRWRGLALKDVAAREPDGFAAWLGDPARRAARRRVACSADRSGRRLARRIVIAEWRNAGGHACLGRSSGDRERARRRLLGLLADRCRAALACAAQRSRRALEPRGARAFASEGVIRCLAAAFLAALFGLGTSASQAHRIAARGGPPPDGIAIPSLTHGQMAVIGDNLSAIRALDSARIGSDMTTWRFEDYLTSSPSPVSGALFPEASRTSKVRSTSAPTPICRSSKHARSRFCAHISIYFDAISKLGAWSGSSRSSTARTSGFPSAPMGQADRLAGAY